MRLGSDGLNATGIGLNTDDMIDPPFDEVGFMLQRADRARREVRIPVGTNWNPGGPPTARSARSSRAA